MILPRPLCEDRFVDRILAQALQSADVLGETFRAYAFPEPGLGAYSTWRLNEAFVPVEDTSTHPLFKTVWPSYEEMDDDPVFGITRNEILRGTRIFSDGVLDLLVFSDGDTTLAFRHRASGVTLLNTDAKCATGWTTT